MSKNASSDISDPKKRSIGDVQSRGKVHNRARKFPEITCFQFFGRLDAANFDDVIRGFPWMAVRPASRPRARSPTAPFRDILFERSDD